MLAGTSLEESRRLNVAGLKQTRFSKQSCCFAQSVYNGWFTDQNNLDRALNIFVWVPCVEHIVQLLAI